MRSPCRGCKDRTMDCHVLCEKYIEYCRLNEAERKQRQGNVETTGVIVNGMSRMTHKKKRDRLK